MDFHLQVSGELAFKLVALSLTVLATRLKRK